VIAGAVFLHFKDTVTYKYGASDRHYLSLRPNNLIMWEAIKWYGRHGYRNLDLGRSSRDNQGLNQFKNGWGTIQGQIAYYRYDLEKQVFANNEPQLSPLIHHAFRKMPVPVLRLLGAIAYRHMA
jgi:lipid II:glycine glycyltransferase (peptidoglycan interpeptide bridge formation enzyme)